MNIKRLFINITHLPSQLRCHATKSTFSTISTSKTSLYLSSHSKSTSLSIYHNVRKLNHTTHPISSQPSSLSPHTISSTVIPYKPRHLPRLRQTSRYSALFSTKSASTIAPSIPILCAAAALSQYDEPTSTFDRFNKGKKPISGKFPTREEPPLFADQDDIKPFRVREEVKKDKLPVKFPKNSNENNPNQRWRQQYDPNKDLNSVSHTDYIPDPILLKHLNNLRYKNVDDETICFCLRFLALIQYQQDNPEFNIDEFSLRDDSQDEKLMSSALEQVGGNRSQLVFELRPVLRQMAEQFRTIRRDRMLEERKSERRLRQDRIRRSNTQKSRRRRLRQQREELEDIEGYEAHLRGVDPSNLPRSGGFGDKYIDNGRGYDDYDQPPKGQRSSNSRQKSQPLSTRQPTPMLPNNTKDSNRKNNHRDDNYDDNYDDGYDDNYDDGYDDGYDDDYDDEDQYDDYPEPPRHPSRHNNRSQNENKTNNGQKKDWREVVARTRLEAGDPLFQTKMPSKRQQSKLPNDDA